MALFRRTKIVCTIGPASNSEEVLRELILEGMNVARFNFSHGAYEEKLETLNLLKKLREELQMPVATLLDTKGPEIRLGKFKGGETFLKEGQRFVLTTNEVEGDSEMASISYKGLIRDVRVGGRVLIDDGLIEMEITNLTETDIVCRVLNGGRVADRKGINVPGTNLSMPFVSQQDYEDILFGIKHEFDFIAASFTRSAEDIVEIKKILEEQGCQTISIIAKIENAQGVDNIDEIIKVSQGIMVARGDMGVEIPFEEVPAIQKKIIRKVYTAGKHVITATQMLDSMMKNPRPTRAEAADVANAIYDGTSAIMLSGETAAGQYPVEAVKTMAKIARKTERDVNYNEAFQRRRGQDQPDVTNAISRATCTTATDLKASAIITVTKSGETVRMISKYRPACPIIGCSTYEHICRKLCLAWGVIPLLVEEQQDTDQLFDHAVDVAQKAGLVQPGQLTVITAGIPLGISGTTNLIKVHVAGHILVKGQGISRKKACASLCVCHSAEELQEKFKAGDIIVTEETTNEMLPQIREAAGLIVEKAGENTHAGIVGLTLDIPVILGAEHATRILKAGAVVTLDADQGVVCCN